MAGLEPATVTATDGFRLGGMLFRPAESNGRAVQIQPATGVRQEYYAKFAAYLAERGFTVLTFDYRGIGRSLPGPLKDLSAGMSDWAKLDGPAALEFLEHAAPQARLMVVGHSFGGQSLGLLPAKRLAAAVVVGSQSGYWRHWSPLGRAWMWPATHVVLPAVSRLCGYFPSSCFGFGEDLPAGVALEWASWCRHPRYIVGALGAHAAYRDFSAPILAYAIDDDRFAPYDAVRALMDLYPNSKSEIRRIDPRATGARRVGHFGFFRERFRETLWRDATDWMLGR